MELAHGVHRLASFTTRCQRQLCQVSESDNYQVRDPWRRPLAHKEQWKPQYVNQQPTLPLPKPEGPEPVCSHDLHPWRSGRILCAQGHCTSVDLHWYHWFVLTFNGHFSWTAVSVSTMRDSHVLEFGTNRLPTLSWRVEDSNVSRFSGPISVKGLQQSCHFEHTRSSKLCF